MTKLAANAPTAITGHNLGPQRVKEATANPDNGQTGDTVLWIKATDKLSQAAPTYEAVKTAKPAVDFIAFCALAKAAALSSWES